MKMSKHYKTLLLVGMVSSSLSSHAQSTQAVTGVVTSYGGYWKSATSAMNLVKPDSSHELLAFTFNGTMYSTGINDGLLLSQSETFVAQEYQALPISGITGTVGANTKVAIGQMYDGVDNGASTPPPLNNIPLYLTDGNQGLNLGTGIANLPAGTLIFSLPTLNASVLGDGIPDLLITQIAQPTGGVDYYKMTDINGAVVGDSIAISFSGIDSVGNWTGDFYEASANPMTLTTSFTKSDRPLRLWAADLSTFGINSSNAAQVKNFVITLNGNSDVAFIAYNLGIGTVLPVSYSYFNAKLNNGAVTLEWETASENNTRFFDVETSNDGKVFRPIGKVNAAGNSSTPNRYSFIDRHISEGDHFYRLKQVDMDNKFEYSTVRLIHNGSIDKDEQLTVFPNPVTSTFTLSLPASTSGGTVNIFTSGGKKVISRKYSAGEKQVSVDRAGLAPGSYIVEIKSDSSSEYYTKFIIPDGK